ncbi:HAD family phosphatase [Eubacteriales bacterium OttesenSCG-928-M02]|nr:HAD family phosphatase [Eubacteriales bacterium OttesenSCG-928-M02]
MLDTVIFDMDGLMFDTERLNQMIYLQTYQEKGYPMTEAVFNKTIGEGREGTFRVFSEAFGAEFTTDTYRTIQAEIKERTLAYAKERPIPKMKGLDEILDYLRNKGYRMGVCTTSATDHAKAFLTNTDKLAYFAAVVGGDMVERSKPFPDLYLKALEALGVSAGQCIALEDSNNGVLSADGAGIRVIMIPDILPPIKKVTETYYTKVDSLLDVPPILEALQAEDA